MAKDRPESPDVRLDSITIERFRSCHHTVFEPNAGLCALIGINGAGKTNVLEVIRLLDVNRGRAARRGIDVNPGSSLTAQVTAFFTVGGSRVGLRSVYGTADRSRRDEMVPLDERWNLSSITGSRAWRPMPPAHFLKRNMRFDPQEQLILVDEDEGRFTYSRRFERFDTRILENPATIEAVIAVEEFRGRLSYYSASQFTDPTRCPTSFEVDEEGALVDAYRVGPHARFLHNLYSLRKDSPELYAEYCRFVSRKQLGLISRLTWKEIELSSSTADVRSGGSVKKVKKRKTMVIPKIQVGSAHITFNQLSEGTFKTLALAFYIITDVSRLLMIEEPEVCVHHGLLRRLIDTIKAYSHRKQIIISTHSDLLVDELDPADLFVVKMTSVGTEVSQLQKSLDPRSMQALHTYLQESGPLGEYWRSGGLS